MRQRIASSICAIVALGFSASAGLAEIAPGDVKFDDGAVAQSLTGVPGNPGDGKKWFVNRKLGNCLACHKNSDAKNELFHGEIGPSLDGVAERYDEAHLRGLLVNAKETFPDTMMPSFYNTDRAHRPLKKFAGKTILTAQQVEDIVAYLKTLK